MMNYELSFITGRPWVYEKHNRDHRRILRETREEIIELADEICLTRGFELIESLRLLLNENEGKWETVYDTPLVYVNMFLTRYDMHISDSFIPSYVYHDSKYSQ